jgi:Na+/H+-dicarboxylate symporter
MGVLGLVLLVFAFVCAALAAYGVNGGRWQLGWASLAFYFAALIFGSVTQLIH